MAAHHSHTHCANANGHSNGVIANGNGNGNGSVKESRGERSGVELALTSGQIARAHRELRIAHHQVRLYYAMFAKGF